MTDRERKLRSSDEREAERASTDAPIRAPDPVQRLAAAIGNRAFSGFATEAAGVLPDGTAHPDVEHAIARMRGSGSPLDSGTKERVGPALGDSFDDVRVHTDHSADTLAKSVSARAFATGADVFFAQGEYQPSTGSGESLLAHELSHVAQQRGAPTSGPMVVSEPGDALEIEAEAAANELTD
jgi:hypothetical protein